MCVVQKRGNVNQWIGRSVRGRDHGPISSSFNQHFFRENKKNHGNPW